LSSVLVIWQIVTPGRNLPCEITHTNESTRPLPASSSSWNKLYWNNEIAGTF
jgi:hypothetical protein